MFSGCSLGIYPRTPLANFYGAGKQKLLDELHRIVAVLTDHGIRVECDTREHYSPGWRLNRYELRGFPLRIEFGPKNAANDVITTVRRDTGEKGTVQVSHRMAQDVQALLDKMQREMLERACNTYREHIRYISIWADVQRQERHSDDEQDGEYGSAGAVWHPPFLPYYILWPVHDTKNIKRVWAAKSSTP